MAGGSKTVVIHPPQEVEADFIDYPWFTDLPALLLATAMRRRGMSVHLLDAFALPGSAVYPQRGGRMLYGIPYPALLERLKDADFDVAVLHVTPYLLAGSLSHGFAFLARVLRELRPASRLVAAELYTGGMHRVEADPEELRSRYPELDHFVPLEGEETIPELIAALERPPAETPPFLVPGRPISRDTLDAITPPDLTFLDRDAHRAFLAAVSHQPKAREYGLTADSFPVFFSRGCPFSCSFCTNPSRDYRAATSPWPFPAWQMSSSPGGREPVPGGSCVEGSGGDPPSPSPAQNGGTTWGFGVAGRLRAAAPPAAPEAEQRLPASAAKGVTRPPADAPLGRLFVLDDAANVRRDFGAVLDAAVAAGPRLEFPNGLRADLLTEELVGKLKLVCDRITVSAESALPRVQREIIGKSVDVAHVERAAAWCRAAGLPLFVHWMVALPGETADELVETLSAARRLLDDHGATPLIQYATPVPGTRLFEVAPAPKAWTRECGERMQHRPTWVPEGVDPAKLALAVDLLRRRADSSKTAKVIINVTYKCNNHCVFCAVGNRIQEHLPIDRIREVLERYRREGVTQLDLDGGEPTLRDDFLEIIAYAVQLGYRPINVTTNGRRLAYRDFAARLLGSGITDLLISVHGPTAEIHEQITGVQGSFAETMSGIRNAVALKPPGLELGVNTTLSRHNFQHLGKLIERLHDMGVEKVNIQFLTPFGRADAGVVPRIDEAAAAARDALERWKDKVKIQVINLPPCYLPGFEQFVGVDLGKLARNMVFVTGEEVNLHRYLAGTRRHDAECATCILRVACDGKYDFSVVLS